jgi:hypothetical protein
MLQVGGMPLLTDGERAADEDNPEGYYEFERVKQLPRGDFDWLAQATGRAVKVISALVKYLPPSNEYRILLMCRNMSEILASQQKMMQRSDRDDQHTPDDVMARSYRKHLRDLENWLMLQGNIRFIRVNYNQLFESSTEIIREIDTFLDNTLDTVKMDSVINPELYRQRAARG